MEREPLVVVVVPPRRKEVVALLPERQKREQTSCTTFHELQSLGGSPRLDQGTLAPRLDSQLLITLMQGESGGSQSRRDLRMWMAMLQL